MKRFPLVALLAAAMIVGAPGVASAASSQTKTYVLTPTTSDLPIASGRVSITIVGPYVEDGYGYDGSYRLKYYFQRSSCQFSGLAASTGYYLNSDISGPVFFIANGIGYARWEDSAPSVVPTKTFPRAFYVIDSNTGVVVLSSK